VPELESFSKQDQEDLPTGEVTGENKEETDHIAKKAA
jgi:hypothetical protein